MNLDILETNITVLLSAQLAILIGFEPVLSLASAAKSLPESTASKMQALCFVFTSKVASKEPAQFAREEINTVKKMEMGI